MGTNYQNDANISISDLISIIDRLTDANGSYMETKLGTRIRNLQSVIGSMVLDTVQQSGGDITSQTTVNSTNVTNGNGAFVGATQGDIYTITDQTHADYGNHIIRSVVSGDEVILWNALTETKVNVTFVVKSGAYNLTDAINDLASRTYRVEDFQVTGTQGAPQTVLFSSLTDKDTGVALITTITNPIIMVSPTTGRGVNIVRASITNTQFQIAMSATGPVGNVYCDLLITSYPN